MSRYSKERASYRGASSYDLKAAGYLPSSSYLKVGSLRPQFEIDFTRCSGWLQGLRGYDATSRSLRAPLEPTLPSLTFGSLGSGSLGYSVADGPKDTDEKFLATMQTLGRWSLEQVRRNLPSPPDQTAVIAKG